jgi:hypothetical protein
MQEDGAKAPIKRHDAMNLTRHCNMTDSGRPATVAALDSGREYPLMPSYNDPVKNTGNLDSNIGDKASPGSLLVSAVFGVLSSEQDGTLEVRRMTGKMNFKN